MLKDIDVYNYLRHEKKFPLMWCAGCGNGIILGSIIRAVDTLGLDKNKVAMVSGIGCSGRTSTYVDFNTLHTTHGRALAFATGLKHANNSLTTLVVTGDGSCCKWRREVAKDHQLGQRWEVIPELRKHGIFYVALKCLIVLAPVVGCMVSPPRDSRPLGKRE